MRSFGMGAFQAMGAMVVGFSILSTGCLDGEDATSTQDVPPVLDAPPVDLTGLGTSGGTNGFDSLSFHLYRNTVHTSMGAPLAELVLDQWQIRNTPSNQALLTDLLAGRETLRYGLRCALAEGDSVSGGIPSETFVGQGIVAKTTGWKTQSLTTLQKESLFSCMLAHLNSAGVQVPIMLSGSYIYDSPSFDQTSYDFDEARWVTSITYNNGSAVLHFDVWPTQDLDNFCLLDLTGVLQLRLCGSMLSICNLTVRTDMSTACSETNTGWECDGKPALQTKLQSTDVPILYAGCNTL